MQSVTSYLTLFFYIAEKVSYGIENKPSLFYTEQLHDGLVHMDGAVHWIVYMAAVFMRC